LRKLVGARSTHGRQLRCVLGGAVLGDAGLETLRPRRRQSLVAWRSPSAAISPCPSAKSFQWMASRLRRQVCWQSYACLGKRSDHHGRPHERHGNIPIHGGVQDQSVLVAMARRADAWRHPATAPVWRAPSPKQVLGASLLLCHVGHDWNESLMTRWKLKPYYLYQLVNFLRGSDSGHLREARSQPMHRTLNLSLEAAPWLVSVSVWRTHHDATDRMACT